MINLKKVYFNHPTFLSLIIIILVQFPLIWPFFHEGFFPSHDDVQLVRIFELHQSLKFGDWPPRWQSNLLYGHGYPVFNFYGQFPFLIGVLLSTFGINYLLSLKLTFILSFFIGGIGCFFAAKQLFNLPSAVTSSIIFSLLPYRAADVYVRGNLGEFFSYQFFPWVLFFNLKLLQSSKPLNWITPYCLGLFIILISHNISALIFIAFLFCLNLFYIISYNRNRLRNIILSLSAGFGLAIGLSAYFIFPIIYESKFIKLNNFEQYPYYNYFVNLEKLWDQTWKFGTFDSADPVSVQFGKVVLVSVIISILFLLKIKSSINNLMLFFLLIFAVGSFLETKYSEFIWKNLTIIRYLQFGWRIHIITTFIACLICGYLIYTSTTKIKSRLLSFILILSLIGGISLESLPFFKPEKFQKPRTVAETTTWDDEYMPRWVIKKPITYAPDKVYSLDNTSARFSNISWGYLQKSFTVESTKSAQVRIAHIYYPGWNAYLNSQPATINYTNNLQGLMTIQIPAGLSKIDFRFELTWWRLISKLFQVHHL